MRGPIKGVLLLVAIACVLILALMAVQGRFTPKRPAVDKIAFISTRSGHPDLWLMDLDGSHARPLTRDSHADGAPSWSKDGSRIVFGSERDRLSQVFVIEAMRDNPARQLTVGTGMKLLPSLSPDGRRIAYLSQGKVYAMDSDGSEIEQLMPVLVSDGGMGDTPVQPESSPYIEVDWSADGEALAAVRDIDGVQVAQTMLAAHKRPDESSGPQDLTDLNGRPISGERVSVKWAPASKRIAVSATEKNKGALLVLEYGAEDLSVESQEIAVTDMVPGKAAWSPTEKQIAFEVLEYREGRGYSTKGLAVVDLDSGKSKAIAGGACSAPSWSADGKAVIFTRAGKDAVRDIWSVKPNGEGSKNLTSGVGDNYDAAASPVGAR